MNGADVNWSALCMEVIDAGLIILQLLEIGQDIVIAPALVAELAPTIIVASRTPIIDHAIDR